MKIAGWFLLGFVVVVGVVVVLYGALELAYLLR